MTLPSYSDTNLFFFLLRYSPLLSWSKKEPTSPLSKSSPLRTLAVLPSPLSPRRTLSLPLSPPPPLPLSLPLPLSSTLHRAESRALSTVSPMLSPLPSVLPDPGASALMASREPARVARSPRRTSRSWFPALLSLLPAPPLRTFPSAECERPLPTDCRSLPRPTLTSTSPAQSPCPSS